jgi:hypothetical protein
VNAAHKQSGCKRSRRPSAAYVGLALVTALIALAVAPSASSAATSTDRKATGAFLEATYVFDRAALANASASSAASAAYVAKLSGECPGVLANAPSPAPLGQSAHATPEQTKEMKQLDAIQSELYLALLSSWLAPDHVAFEALARVVRPLRWSSARITRLAHAEVMRYEQEVGAQPPDVCADMRAWASSDYQTLPPSALAALRRLTGEGDGSPSLAPLIARQEGPALKQLARRREHVAMALQKRLGQALSGVVGLLRTLGLDEPAPVGAEQSPGEESRGAGAIGHGTTAAGTSYTVLATAPSKSCPVNLAISETSNGNRMVIGECLSRSTRPMRPSIGCNEGHVTIWTPLPPRVRLVALKLSNGRTIVSRALSVPASDGGPLGFYYQALPHLPAKPVSLTELDTHDRRVRELRIGSTPACRMPREGTSSSSADVPYEG